VDFQTKGMNEGMNANSLSLFTCYISMI